MEDLVMKIAAALSILMLSATTWGQADQGLSQEDIARLKALRDAKIAEAQKAAKDAAVKANAQGPQVGPAVEVPAKEAPVAKDAQYYLFPAGIADKDWKKAYILGADGTLCAIDLSNGKLLWHSAVQAVPLALDGDRVYALSPSSGAPPALNVVGLSIKGEGKLAFKSDSIPADEWITGDLAGKTLSASVVMENGKMKLTWAAGGSQAMADGGMMRGGRRVVPRRMQAVAAEGSVTVDLQKGTVEENKNKLTIPPASTSLTHGEKEFVVTVDAEKGKSTLECRNATSKKTNWQVEILPSGKAANLEVGAGAPAPMMRPMPAELFIQH
jgi:hypothetical protein